MEVFRTLYLRVGGGHFVTLEDALYTDETVEFYQLLQGKQLREVKVNKN